MDYLELEEYIVAVATPPGDGSFDILRLSGINLVPIYKKITKNTMNKNEKDVWNRKKLRMEAEFGQNILLDLDSQLIKYGETKRGWLGVRIQEVTKEIAEVQNLDEPKGALVAGISQNSPAEKAGIEPGDIILEFDGNEINTMRNLPKIDANTKVGKNVSIKIWRYKKLINKILVLGRLESSKEFIAENKPAKKNKEVEIEDLKITESNLSSDEIEKRKLDVNLKGVIVVDILPRSSLVRMLTPGDIIVELQKKPIRDTEDLKKVAKQIISNGKKTILIRFINRNNQPSYGTVKIK